MRFKLLLAIIVFPLLLYSQKAKNELISIAASDLPLETILEQISDKSSYFFSYNSDLFPKGSRYSISAENEPIDQLLSRLLVGTGLKYSFFKDQIILNYQPPELEPIRKKNFFTLSGKVFDENGEPLSGVNIFLDGTSIGSFSDIDGNYLLESIPPGFYDLVFSHIGYENGVYGITEYNGGARIQNHNLTVWMQELEEIIVVVDQVNNRQNNWQVYYTIFLQELLGNSEIAGQCIIENPEVINFSKDSQSDKLYAYANDVIIIRNDALGYRIDYFLESFERQENDLRFRGKMRFRNQSPLNQKERREWKRNRKKCFYGSFNHFKKSLLSRSLRKEGFRIYASNMSNNVIRKRRNAELSESDILVFKGDSYELSFNKNLLVEFKKEKESVGFLSQRNLVRDDGSEVSQDDLAKQAGSQLSVIRLLKSPVKIDLTGQILDRFAISTNGYWSWERVGDLVPINYDTKWDNL